MKTVEIMEPDIQIVSYEGNPFSIDEKCTVRCIVMDDTHWRRGKQFHNPAFKEWDYLPYYECTIEVQNFDPQKKTDVPKKSFKVNVLMSTKFFRKWHMNKGSGYNNCEARRIFIEEWMRYMRIYLHHLI